MGNFTIDDPYLLRLAQIESGMNPLAKNPNSSAGGLFQFVDATANQYGLAGRDRFIPEKAIPAAKKLTDDNRAYLKKALGREPTPGELYLAHQQGALGAKKLLSNPNSPVTKIVGKDAAILNAGTTDMTAGEFVNNWSDKFESGLESDDDWETIESSDNGDWEDVAIEEDVKIPEKKQKSLSVALKGAPLSIAKGTTLGFSDEIQGALAAIPAAIGRTAMGNPTTIGEAYKIGRDIARRQQGDFEEQNPYISSGLEFVGGLTGGIGAAKIAPSKLTAFARSNPVKSAIYGGAASGGLYGAGASEKEGFGRLEDAVSGTGVGGVTGGTVGYLANRIIPKKIPSSEEMRKQASKIFKLSEESGVIVPAKEVDNFITNIKSNINTGRAGNVGRKYMGLVDDVIEDIQNEFQKTDMSVQDINQLDSRLGDLIDSTMDDFGKVGARGRLLIQVQKSLRDMFENLPGTELSKQAREAWAKSYRIRDIERVIEKSLGTDQPANTIKRGLNSLLRNKAKLNGYNKEEIKAIKEAARTGFPAEMLRTVGSRLVGIGGTVMGGAPGAVASVGAGMLARDIGKNAAEDQALRAMQIIANRGTGKIVGSTIPGSLGTISGMQSSAQVSRLRNRNGE